MLVISVAAFAFPAGVTLAMLSTPLLWKLEEPLHLELAGHSGPADWVILGSGLIAALAAGAFTYRRTART